MEDAQSKLEADVFVTENLKRAQDFFKARDFQKCVSECQRIQLLDADNAVAGDLLRKRSRKWKPNRSYRTLSAPGSLCFNSVL